MRIAVVALYLLLALGVRAQNGGPFDHTTSPPVSLNFVVGLADAEFIQDFCIRVGVTHTSIMDLRMVLSFESIQQGDLSLTVLDQPENQLDNIDAGTEVFFTTFSFQTPSSELGFIDQDPVSGFFFAEPLLQTLGMSNVGTWTLTVEDLVNNADVGNLVSFTPIFNDPATCGQSGAPSSSPSRAPSSPPVATPTGTPTTVAACFSGANLVHVRGRGDIPMESLSIGDFVKSNDGYAKVYGFLHLNRDIPTEFLQIAYYNSGTKLSSFIEVTADHLLFSRGRTIAAHQVAVGTILDGDHNVDLQVTHILKVHRQGVFAPATESGELVVAGVRASNYVRLLSTTGTPIISQHTMAHVFLAPVRIFAMYYDAATTMYTDEGYAEWVVVYLRIAAQLDRLPLVLLYIVTIAVLLPLMLVLVLVEYASIHFCSPVSLCTCLALVVTARYRSQKAVSGAR